MLTICIETAADWTIFMVATILALAAADAIVWVIFRGRSRSK